MPEGADVGVSNAELLQMAPAAKNIKNVKIKVVIIVFEKNEFSFFNLCFLKFLLS